MKLNGLPMTLQSLRSQLPPTAVLEHFSNWWSVQTEGVRGATYTARDGRWQILGFSSRDLHITVRISATASGSIGTLAVSRNPSSTPPSVETTFPSSHAARVVNLQEYEDDGISAEHISFQSARSVATEAHEFRRLLQREGWSIYRDEMSRTTTGGRVLETQKGANVAQLTFTPAPPSGSHIIVIWRKE